MAAAQTNEAQHVSEVCCHNCSAVLMSAERSRGGRRAEGNSLCGLSECGLVRRQLGRELIRRGTLPTCLSLK